MNSQEIGTQNGAAPAARPLESGEAHDRVVAGSTARPPATPVSMRKIEANRRNVQQSTGPKTEAGKHASRMNALTHGLLAKDVVITRGDYKEDEQQFAQLLEELQAQFQPVGVAEELEVQKIAGCYWRKSRAIRYEHGAILQKTGDLRGREQRSRQEDFDHALEHDVDIEGTSHGIQYLIDGLGEAKQEALDRQVSSETLEWLVQQFPNHVALPEGTRAGALFAEKLVALSPDNLQKLGETIDAQRRRLARLRPKIVRAERLDLESKSRAAALPGLTVVDKLVRYETSNERELDRALTRLERMQERRRANAGAAPER
jgi:hypothetical protein